MVFFKRLSISLTILPTKYCSVTCYVPDEKENRSAYSFPLLVPVSHFLPRMMGPAVSHKVRTINNKDMSSEVQPIKKA